jgi:hypothetical protein
MSFAKYLAYPLLSARAMLFKSSSVAPNHSIEATSSSKLRLLPVTAHVER